MTSTASHGSRTPSDLWADTPERWDKLVDVLLRKGEAGIDSETYDQPDKTSPQHRTKIHHWSIAVLTNQLTTRNYHRAKGWALPRAALDYAPLRDALRSITLWAHNSPHDEHSFRNEGLDLVIQDTLQWCRVAVPGAPGYGLKTKGSLLGIEQWALGKPIRDNFKQMVSYEVQETNIRIRHETRCVCGKVPCRKRSDSEFMDRETLTWRKHERQEVPVETPVTRTVKKKYAVTDFNPDHPTWALWLPYVVVDAESGIELVDYLRRRPYPEKEYPWVRQNNL